MTRAEELAERGYTGEALAALSELVADAEALAEALERVRDLVQPGGVVDLVAHKALARYRGEEP